jgi:glyoxylase-like metal-dependent hydrolase (beta-lactamase superfamily II)
MHTALTKLSKLPDDTKVWNGHEYTKGSAAFGLKIEPDNKALQGWVWLGAELQLSESLECRLSSEKQH